MSRMISDAPAPTDRSRRRLAKIGCVALVALALLLLVGKLVSEQRQTTSPSATSTVAGTTVEVLPAAELDRMGFTWADAAEASTNGEYAVRLTGRPDVFPAARNDANAWYASRDDRGTEWVLVSWNIAWEAQQIVILETFHPGAVVAVDDVEDYLDNKLGAGRFARLWSGTTPVAAGSRALVLRLARPRRIAALRIVLDTARARGSNQLDAVGLRAPH